MINAWPRVPRCCWVPSLMRGAAIGGGRCAEVGEGSSYVSGQTVPGEWWDLRIWIAWAAGNAVHHFC